MQIPQSKQIKTHQSKKEDHVPLLQREIKIFPDKIKEKEKVQIYRQLHVLQKSGVDIKVSFEILIKQVKKKVSKQKLQQVLEELIQGKSLSDSFAHISDFTPYEVYSIRIGEETGRLNDVLERLTIYFESQVAQRKQVVSAMSYPILIVFTSIATVTFMMFFIIPMFEDVFQNFNKDLPALTRVIIDLSQWVRASFGYFFIFVLLLFSGLYFLKDYEWFQRLKEWVVLKIPIMGTVYKQVFLSRFCDAMALLITSSVPMIRTLEMVGKMIGMVHLKEATDRIQQALIQGKSVELAFSEIPLFDDQMKALIKVGEEVNQLGDFFEKMAFEYNEEAKHQTAMLTTFLEPVMILFLGSVVGAILVAMYLPMFELSSSMDFGN